MLLQWNVKYSLVYHTEWEIELFIRALLYTSFPGIWNERINQQCWDSFISSMQQGPSLCSVLVQHLSQLGPCPWQGLLGATAMHIINDITRNDGVGTPPGASQDSHRLDIFEYFLCWDFLGIYVKINSVWRWLIINALSYTYVAVLYASCRIYIFLYWEGIRGKFFVCVTLWSCLFKGMNWFRVAGTMVVVLRHFYGVVSYALHDHYVVFFCVSMCCACRL